MKRGALAPLKHPFKFYLVTPSPRRVFDLTPSPYKGKGEVVLRGGLRPPLFYSSPSPRMERGTKGVRLINNFALPILCGKIESVFGGCYV